jgi:hypothetical protein
MSPSSGKKGTPTSTLLGPIDRASPYLGDRLQSPKRRVFFDQG